MERWCYYNGANEKNKKYLNLIPLLQLFTAINVINRKHIYKHCSLLVLYNEHVMAFSTMENYNTSTYFLGGYFGVF